MEYFVSSGRRKSIAEVDVPVRIPFDIDALRWPICIRVYKHLAATTTIEVETQCLRPPTYLILSPRFNCVPSRTVVNRFESNIFGAKCGDAAQRDRCHDCCLTRFKLKFTVQREISNRFPLERGRRVFGISLGYFVLLYNCDRFVSSF